ncbi:type II secretion system F family protein [Gardnerella vaginalis]|uniref:Type II secretion system protein GspF domain-containing protein n=1 Tax=Gardnerella vaginalis TaxID=2702 RepID=A0A133NPD4_GARVA|nr:type II secretion system F family protein [Gardnerella vaginalis]KXA18098.1 hypothetical protein HMPREF3216_00887 [Gardnerella vaginalis]
MLKAIIIWIILVAYIIVLCKLFSKQVAVSSLYNRACKPAIFMQETYEFRQNTINDIDPILGLQMIIVALKSGVAITRALDAVGCALPASKGIWLKRVSKALISGSTWREAWSAPHVYFNKKDKNSYSSLVLSAWLKNSLSESWSYGSSPVPVLNAVLQNYEQSMKNIAKKESSRLSVRLLLPVGLCFLPAFIFVGILPTVAAFMH